MNAPAAYEHLAPELQRLRGDALRVWGDGRARRRAFSAIVRSWESGGRGLGAAIRSVDDPVVEGLQLLGLPRGSVAGFDVDDFGRGFTARLGYDRIFQLDAPTARALLGARRGADDLFRTWLHESIHGRHVDRIESATEPRLYRGYEEGLVEGLAQLITTDKAAMRPRVSSYHWYVVAYQRLAVVAGLSVEHLWRALWHLPRGQVRNGFLKTVDQLYVAAHHSALTSAWRAKLGGQADRQFSTERQNATPNAQTLDLVWRAVFR